MLIGYARVLKADDWWRLSVKLFSREPYRALQRECPVGELQGHRGQRAYSCLVAAEGLCTNAGLSHDGG